MNTKTASQLHNELTDEQYYQNKYIEINELLSHIPVFVSEILEGYHINAQILSRQTIRELNTQILEKFKKELK